MFSRLLGGHIMTRQTLLTATFSWAVLTLFSANTLATDEARDDEREEASRATASAVQQPYGYIAPVALSSPNLASGAASLFQPWFDAATFAGDLRAYRVNSAGRLATTPHWRALDTMNRLAAANPQFWQNERIIVTSNGEGKGIPFRYNRLSATQRAQVKSEAVVDFVRGKRDVNLATSLPCGEKDDDKEEGASDDSSHSDDSGDKNSADRSSKKSSYQPPPPRQVSGVIKVASLHRVAKEGGETESDDGGPNDDNNPQRKDCGPTSQQLDRPLIGAIVHSRPVYVGLPREGLPFDGYLADFAARMADRQPIVYVGANDGMLHAFDAVTGREIFAYVPSAVMGRLPLYASLPPNSASVSPASESTMRESLPTDTRNVSVTDESTSGFVRTSSSSSNSDHKEDEDNITQPPPAPTRTQLVYTVDGFVTAEDIQINKQWKTILVGGLGAGGQGFYALDVTDAGTAATSEETAGDLLLWEFDDRKEASLGYTYSRPSVIRLRDSANTWAVVVGNGYFSEKADGQPGSGEAALLILNAATGQLMRKIPVHSRASDQPNGLSSPTVIDGNNDHRADYVYAGDLHGNVWKFDIRNSDPSHWRVANQGAPMFVARDDSGKLQPITAAPAVGFHPITGFLVTIGTGKVLTNTDIKDGQVQSVYGLWDDPEHAVAITQLSTTSLAAGSATMRTLPGMEIDWVTQQGWKVNLPSGERVLTEAIIRNERVQFTSTNPKTGENLLNEFDLATGSAPTRPFWDLNNDGVLNDGDLVDGDVPVSKAQGVGLVSRPAIGMTTPGRDAYYINRLVTASKQCIDETRPRKKSKREQNDDGSDDSRSDDRQSSRTTPRSLAQFAAWQTTDAAPRSFLLKTSGKSGGKENKSVDDEEEEDDDSALPPEECVEPPDEGGDDDKNDDRGGTCGRDFEKEVPPPTPPPAEVTSVGTVEHGTQRGHNATGRKVWREVIPTEK